MGFQDRRYSFSKFTNWMPDLIGNMVNNRNHFPYRHPRHGLIASIVDDTNRYYLLHFILLVPKIIVKRGHGSHIWGR